MHLLKEFSCHVISQHGRMILENQLISPSVHLFLPRALLQVTQAILEAVQVLAGPVLIEDTTEQN